MKTQDKNTQRMNAARWCDLWERAGGLAYRRRRWDAWRYFTRRASYACARYRMLATD
jgi:hypothetical protein